MAEYITREAALMAVCRAELPDKTEDGIPIAKGKRKVSDCVRRIKAIPAADVVDRKHGKWITKYPLSTCSVCEQTMILHDFANFCPNCGADMRGEDDV